MAKTEVDYLLARLAKLDKRAALEPRRKPELHISP